MFFLLIISAMPPMNVSQLVPNAPAKILSVLYYLASDSKPLSIVLLGKPRILQNDKEALLHERYHWCPSLENADEAKSNFLNGRRFRSPSLW